MQKSDAAVIGCACLLTAVMLLGSCENPSAETISWGLSFQTPGQTPSGPESQEDLSTYDAVFVDKSGEKVIYLTFDAGYENGCTAGILDILKAREVRAAFFLVGNYMERNPDLVRRMAAEGHTVGNHTMHHPDMSQITDPGQFAAELTQLADLYTQITGLELPRYYRPPQGNYTRENLKMARDLGYKTVFWSLAYADWDNENQPDPQAALDKLTERIHPGAVVLLHSTSRTNLQILDTLLTRWKEMGYRFGTLEELFAA